jgi:hypothetical protein
LSILPTGVFVSAIPIETRGIDFGNYLACGVYSAACETVMRPAASSTDLTMLW